MFGGPPIYSPYDIPMTRPVMVQPQPVYVPPKPQPAPRTVRKSVEVPSPDDVGIVLPPPEVKVPQPDALGIKLD
jgi:hypothetical protein